jgi:polygalacturonase
MASKGHSSEVSQAQASPYNIRMFGAPAASNEDVRAATAAAIDAARISHDPEFGGPSKSMY